MTPLVSARGLRMSFAGVDVVKGVDLDLLPGEVHAIVGENGAGKSTVAKLIAGVHQPVAGSIKVNGAEVSLANPRQAIQLGIALIHQEPLTFPDLDVAENIFVGHQPVSWKGLGVHWRGMWAEGQAILDTIGVRLNPRDRVGSLSVADQQMVELAAALSHKAKVLILDETTAALTPKEVAELFTIVLRMRDQGCAIVFVSHHLDEIFEIADRVTVMRDGEKVGELIPKETNVAALVKLMVGRDVELAHRDRASTSGEVFLETKDLSLKGRFTGVNLRVGKGEIVGIGGLVGAGRTDVCQCLFGINRPTSGTILVEGRPQTFQTPKHAMSAGIAMVPEDRQHEGLLTPMPIMENATLAVLGRAFGAWLKPTVEADMADTAVRRMQTAFRSVEQPVRELSGGNQQKVVLAKWLMTEPRLLILDEPTRGVDVGAKAEVHRLIRELVDQGMSILMVSSDLPELLGLSDRVYVMREGSIVAEFSGAEATQESVMFAATGQDRHAS